MFHQELAAEGPYQASIEGIKLKLVELQSEDGHARKIIAEKLGGNWEDFDRILHYECLLYIPEIIRTKLISRHNDNLLAGYFSIKKIRKLVTRKYYWETFYHNVKMSIRDYIVYLAFKAVRYKPYENLQQLPV